MRILYSLITILFFSFNNANAETLTEYLKDIKDAMIKGEILYAYDVANKGDALGEERFIVRYNGKNFKCSIDYREYSCIGIKYEHNVVR